MNLLRLRIFYLLIIVKISFSLAKNETDYNQVSKTSTSNTTSYNCTLNSLLKDIFQLPNQTLSKKDTTKLVSDKENSKDYINISKLNVSNIGTRNENGSIEQHIVDGIIASINLIKNHYDLNLDNETDATKINDTVIVEKKILQDIIFLETKNVTILVDKNETQKVESDVSSADGDDIKTPKEDNKPITYVEVLTVEPNNTSPNIRKSTENILDLLKHLMPGLRNTNANVTAVKQNSAINNILQDSTNRSTIIIAYCNENSTQSEGGALKSNETIQSNKTLMDQPEENTDHHDINALMVELNVSTSYDDMMKEAMNLTVLEKNNILKATNFGIQMMHELYSIKEPKLYSMGLWLDDSNPARYVAAFNAPSEDSAKYFRYGYASLQAATKLQQLLSGASGEAGEALQGREEEAALPGVAALRHSALLDQCPLKGAPKCPPASKRYRTHDGTCNNLSRPRWGSSMTPVQRFLAPHYADGLQAPRRSVSGARLPSPREVSALVHEDHNVETASVTHLLMQWGQFVDHDLTSSSQSRGFNGSVPRCCRDGGRDFVPKELMHPECMPISVLASDQFYGPLGVRCLEFVRSSPAPQDDCALGWREQLNQVSAYLDGSPIYGSSARASDRLRLFRNGMLQYGRVQQRRPVLPPERSRKDELCRAGAVSTDCFKSGDNRVNEHPGLVAAHIVWLRQHNRMATELAHLNPHWSDEKIYQETRKIVGAMLQHITYKEFLPIVLGSEVMRLFDLEPQKKGFYRNYNPKVNPSPASSFGSAAFRFGHSLVQGSMMRYDRHHRPIHNNVSLHEELTNPSNIWSVGAVDRLLLGMVNQPIQKRDEFITEELTNHLFQTPQFDFGMDLAAINIQRGRDHGMAAYPAWREPCGLTEIRDFEDLFRVMPSRAATKLQDLYRHVDDIDLFTGGMAERPVVGGLVGPTFACIIAQQFSNLRKGDRFWYENGAVDSSFTPAQLQQIRRITLAQILCKTLDSIDNIQPFVFLAADMNENRRISCANGIFNNFDLSPWTEIDSTLDNSVEFDKSDKITEGTVNKQKTTQKPDSDLELAHDQTASGSNKVPHIKPANFMTNSTKAHNSITKKKTKPRPTNGNKTTNKSDTLQTDITTTKSKLTMQHIDDKLDFKHKRRRYDNFQPDSEDDDTQYNTQKQNYNFNHDYNNDDNKYGEDESNVYQQAVIINNHRTQRPNKYNRPVIAVTENIDKFTYLINYVPKTTPRPWRQTTRRPSYDRDVVKVTYQTYDDTYRRPHPQYVNNHQTLPTYYSNRHVQKPNKYDEYQRTRPDLLTTRHADNTQSSARAGDLNPFFTKSTAAVAQKASTKGDEIIVSTTTEQFHKLVTFSHLGTYNKMAEFDKDVTMVNSDLNKKENNFNEKNNENEQNIYSKDFVLNNDKADKQDKIMTKLFTTSSPLKLTTFFSTDKELRYNSLNRLIMKSNTTKNHRLSTSNDKSDPKIPGRYYYVANILYRYPDADSTVAKSEVETDINSNLTKENYKPRHSTKQRENVQERSSVDTMALLEDIDKNIQKEGKVKNVKPNHTEKTHSVAFQVIPSENSPTTWVMYEEKSEPNDDVSSYTMPAVSSDPNALQELPRPMNLSVVGKLGRRKPSKA